MSEITEKGAYTFSIKFSSHTFFKLNLFLEKLKPSISTIFEKTSAHMYSLKLTYIYFPNSSLAQIYLLNPSSGFISLPKPKLTPQIYTHTVCQTFKYLPNSSLQVNYFYLSNSSPFQIYL